MLQWCPQAFRAYCIFQAMLSNPYWFYMLMCCRIYFITSVETEVTSCLLLPMTCVILSFVTYDHFSFLVLLNFIPLCYLSKTMIYSFSYNLRGNNGHYCTTNVLLPSSLKTRIHRIIGIIQLFVVLWITWLSAVTIENCRTTHFSSLVSILLIHWRRTLTLA